MSRNTVQIPSNDTWYISVDKVFFKMRAKDEHLLCTIILPKCQYQYSCVFLSMTWLCSMDLNYLRCFTKLCLSLSAIKVHITLD